MINSMHCSNSRHGGALLELHTGSDTFVRPSMGSWITYGLGTENRDLPGFITMCPDADARRRQCLRLGVSCRPIIRARRSGNASVPSDQAKIPFIENAEQRSARSAAAELDLSAAT